MSRKLVLVAVIVCLAAFAMPVSAIEPIHGWAETQGGPAAASSRDLAAPTTTDNRALCDLPCVCDDGVSCTVDTCDAENQCISTIDPAFCFINMACVPAGSISPFNQCKACNPGESQEEYTDRCGPCDDGNQCTTADACSGGICLGGPPAQCDDYNLCTTDSCCASEGCVYAPKDCSDAIACNIDSCDPRTGACTHSKRPALLSYTGPGVAQRGRPIVLSARLTENGSTPIAAGRSVSFRVVTQICIGTTDANGIARCSLVANQTPGAKSVQLSFAGDACYVAGSRNDVLWVQ